MESLVQGKTIQAMRHNLYYEGAYNLDTVSFENAEQVAGATIAKANANFIRTDNDWLVEFGYSPGYIRFFETDGQDILFPSKKAKTGLFAATFLFTDHTRLVLNINTWTNRFRIYPATAEEMQYPFIPKYPLDVTDETDFTLPRFRAWLADHAKTGILETCTTVKGAFDMYNSTMNYLLWQAGIHPKTKCGLLTDDEIKRIYDCTAQLMGEYKTKTRICPHTDLWGNVVDVDDPALTLMTSQNRGQPCPVCGTAITSVAGGGTQLFFCPGCQPVRG